MRNAYSLIFTYFVAAALATYFVVAALVMMMRDRARRAFSRRLQSSPSAFILPLFSIFIFSSFHFYRNDDIIFAFVLEKLVVLLTRLSACMNFHYAIRFVKIIINRKSLQCVRSWRILYFESRNSFFVSPLYEVWGVCLSIGGTLLLRVRPLVS